MFNLYEKELFWLLYFILFVYSLIKIMINVLMFVVVDVDDAKPWNAKMIDKNPLINDKNDNDDRM